MNQDEFDAVIARMQQAWCNQPIPDETADLWWELGLFADLDARDVMAAIVALLATETFSPMPAQIRGWIAQRASADMDAVWSEVWAELMRAREIPKPWSQIEWSDAVRPFVEHVGVQTLHSINPTSETPIGVAQAQLRGMWEGWRARETDRRVTGTVPAVAAFREAHGTQHPLPAPSPARLDGSARVGDVLANVLAPARKPLRVVGEG